MDRGLSYTYNSLAFPRYHYFQARLQRFIPRLQNILEAAGLPDCASQGRIKLKKISSAAEAISDKVTVNLFANAAVLKEQKFDLPEQKYTIGKIRDLQWLDYLTGLIDTSSFEPTVTVFVTQSEDEVHHCVLNKLTEDQYESIIIYNDHTKAAALYTSLAQTSQYSKAMDVDVDEASKYIESVKIDLVHQIQYVLEGKVIAVLEKIAGYIQDFIPRRGEEVDSSLLDAVNTSLINSLRSSFVVRDLSPNNEAILGEKIPTNADIQILSQYIAGQWEPVAIVLGSSQLEIERIKMEKSTLNERSNQVLQRWRDRGGKMATLNKLVKLLKEMKIDVSSLESTFSSFGSDEVKDEIFLKKLTEFVIKKTKCIVCDTLSRKYGISASLLNEFMNEGFFDYQAKILEVLENMEKPKWPRNPSDDGVSTCKTFSYRCALNLNKVMHNTEDYIQAKLAILLVLKKLQFELHGYLIQAKVPITTAVQELPKLPVQLQYELLSIDEVTGCGTCYGDLLLHVTKNLTPARKEEIKQLLQEYNYTDGYKSVIMSEKVEQVITVPLVEHGQELRARKTGQNGLYNFGSVGCFFNLRPKQSASSVSQQNTGAMVSSGYVITEAKDHCVTCAHCLKDCDDDVETRVSGAVMQYSHLGNRKCFLYNPEAIDVASIQVEDKKLEGCDSRLKTSDERCVPNWRVFDVDPIRRDVHKEGSKTGFTRGIVMSTNFITKRIKEYNVLKFQRTRSLAERFEPSFNILIESLPGAGDHIQHVTTEETIEPFEVQPFSQEGDSGSVIISDDADQPDWVNTVALLLGAVTDNNRFLHSYASLMRKTIEEVEVHYDCIATPSRLFPRDINEEAGLAGTRNLYQRIPYQ